MSSFAGGAAQRGTTPTLHVLSLPRANNVGIFLRKSLTWKGVSMVRRADDPQIGGGSSGGGGGGGGGGGSGGSGSGGGVPELCAAIVRLDLMLAEPEMLEAVLSNLPPESEAEQLRALSLPPEQLTPPERFCFEMARLPRLRPRLHALRQRQSLPEKLARATTALGAVAEAARALMESSLFRRLLASILRHGNVLNENTARAGARGVRLDGLEKARAVKSAEGQTSLLEYACAAARVPLEQLQVELSTVRLAIQMPLPEVLRFVKEVEDSVDAVSQELALCPIADLEADVAAGAHQSLEAPETAPIGTDGIAAATPEAAAAAAAKVAGAVAARRGESPDEQQLALRFRWVMEPFLAEMRSGLVELTTRRAETSALLRKLAVWLGEDPAQANPDAMLTACAELVDTATAMAFRPDPVAGPESAREESARQEVAEPAEVDEHADEYF